MIFAAASLTESSIAYISLEENPTLDASATVNSFMAESAW